MFPGLANLRLKQQMLFNRLGYAIQLYFSSIQSTGERNIKGLARPSTLYCNNSKMDCSEVVPSNNDKQQTTNNLLLLQDIKKLQTLHKTLTLTEYLYSRNSEFQYYFTRCTQTIQNSEIQNLSHPMGQLLHAK